MKTLKFIFLFCFSLNIYAQETFTLTVNLQEDVEDNAIIIYRKTPEYPHYAFVAPKFQLEYGLNEMEIELTEGEYLLKSYSLSEGYSLFIDGSFVFVEGSLGELNWTILQ